jgi:polysaccharide pyruvyl transferase WcaK-like protein
MAVFTSRLIQGGYAVRLVTTHARMDSEFINDLKSRLCAKQLKKVADQLAAKSTESFEQIMAMLSKANIVVASRLHAVVFSYLFGIPVIGISYHPKIQSLMRDFGQGEFCVKLTSMDVDDLWERFNMLEHNEARARNQIRKTAEGFRKSLEKQYQELLSL